MREVINLKAAEFALSMSFQTFQSYCKDGLDEEERRKQFVKIRNYCFHALNNGGEAYREYYYVPGKKFGRRFCSESIQPIDRHFRGLLCRGLHTDLDMDNCHPTILLWICDVFKIPCPKLREYVQNRDYHLSQVEDLTGKPRDEGKRLFLISTNSQDNVACEYSFFKEYDQEMKMIQQHVAQLPCYAFVKPHADAKMAYEEKNRERKKKAKRDNYHGVFINLVLCHHESEFMDAARAVLQENDYEPSALMHDGSMILGDHYPNTLKKAKQTGGVGAQSPDGWEDEGMAADAAEADIEMDPDTPSLFAEEAEAEQTEEVEIEIKEGTLNEAQWNDHFPGVAPKTSIRDDIICPLLEEVLKRRFDIDMKWSMKFHTTRLICPDEWDTECRPYECVAEEWKPKLWSRSGASMCFDTSIRANPLSSS